MDTGASVSSVATAPTAEPGRVIALVLAAGASTRFGSDKRQARLPDGRSLLEAVVSAYLDVFDEVWVLTRPGDAYAPAVCAALGVPCRVCDDAAQGLGHTVAAGLRMLVALPEDAAPVQAALIALADMPWVQANTLRRLRARFNATGAVVLPRHGDALGHPRLLPRAVWPGLLGVRAGEHGGGERGGDGEGEGEGEHGGERLRGDRGARSLIDWSSAEQVDVDDAGVLRDADTPADLAR
jgi:molybdenum cofactor cytidylyltransferase